MRNLSRAALAQNIMEKNFQQIISEIDKIEENIRDDIEWIEDKNIRNILQNIENFTEVLINNLKILQDAVGQPYQTEYTKKFYRAFTKNLENFHEDFEKSFAAHIKDSKIAILHNESTEIIKTVNFGVRDFIDAKTESSTKDILNSINAQIKEQDIKVQNGAKEGLYKKDESRATLDLLAMQTTVVVGGAIREIAQRNSKLYEANVYTSTQSATQEKSKGFIYSLTSKIFNFITFGLFSDKDKTQGMYNIDMETYHLPKTNQDINYIKEDVENAAKQIGKELDHAGLDAQKGENIDAAHQHGSKTARHTRSRV